MSTTEAVEQKSLSAQAVDEEYEKLEKYHVNGRRIVFLDDKNAPEGGFGIVRKAELHHSAYLPAWLASRRDGPPQLVAVKQIKMSRISNMPRVKRAFTREVVVWSSLEAHPGIAKFLGFYADFKRSEAWLLSPWEPNGNVSEFIKLYNLEVPEKLSLVYDTIDALTFLHELTPPVCHGDIKSANVLVSAEYKARLCDFGLARLHEDSGFGRLETSTGSKGSIRWCSPELIDGAPRAPTSDVYAWAWLVWEIMTGDVPYEGASTDYAIIRKIFESPLPEVDGKSRLSDCLQVWELLIRCWNVDPLQRPTSKMCNTSASSLPRCTPAPANADHQTRSAALLESLGDLERWKGNLEKSSEYLDEAMRLYQEEANAKGITSILLKKADAASSDSDYVKLQAISTAALEHCRTHNDAFGISEFSFYLGLSLAMLLREPGEGLPPLRESLQYRLAHGDDVGAVRCLRRIGELQRDNGQGLEALSTVGRAQDIASRLGNRLELASVLVVLGTTYTELSDYVKASDVLSEAMTIVQDIEWKRGLGDVLLSMGKLKMRLGNYHEAEQNFKELISIAQQTKNRIKLARGLCELGLCFRRQSKLSQAAPLLEESCLMLREQSQHEISRGIAGVLVEVKSTQGDWDRALFWHDHIIAVYRSEKQLEGEVDHLLQKARMLLKLQRYDEAALHIEAVVAICSERGGSWPWGKTHLCAIPKTMMKWERPSPLLCDLKKLQRRQPRLVSASLKLPIHIGRGE